MTAEALYDYLTEHGWRVRGRPESFMAQCGCPQNHTNGDRNPSVQVSNAVLARGHKRAVVRCWSADCDWREILRGWKLGELVERQERAEAFRRVGAVPVKPRPNMGSVTNVSNGSPTSELVTNVSNGVTNVYTLTCKGVKAYRLYTLVTSSREAKTGKKPLTRRFREDVLLVAADLLAHQAAYDAAGCDLPVLYATSYGARRLGWGGTAGKMRASRALCWLEREGYVAPGAPVGRTKTFRLIAVPAPTPPRRDVVGVGEVDQELVAVQVVDEVPHRDVMDGAEAVGEGHPRDTVAEGDCARLVNLGAETRSGVHEAEMIPVEGDSVPVEGDNVPDWLLARMPEFQALIDAEREQDGGHPHRAPEGSLELERSGAKRSGAERIGAGGAA